MQPSWKVDPSLYATASAVSSHPHPLRRDDHALLQLSLVHSWDRSDEGATLRAAMSAALWRRMGAERVEGHVWAAPHTPAVEVPLEQLNATVLWLTHQEVFRSLPSVQQPPRAPLDRYAANRKPSRASKVGARLVLGVSSRWAS
jgi:hypothetical protein